MTSRRATTGLFGTRTVIESKRVVDQPKFVMSGTAFVDWKVLRQQAGTRPGLIWPSSSDGSVFCTDLPGGRDLSNVNQLGLLESSHLALAARLLSELHGLAVPCGHDVNRSHVPRWWSDVTAARVLKAARSQVEKLAGREFPHPPMSMLRPETIVHGRPGLREFYLDDSGRVSLIGWIDAGVSSPIGDIARLVAEVTESVVAGLSPVDATALGSLLDAYADGPAGPFSSQELIEIYRAACAFVADHTAQWLVSGRVAGFRYGDFLNCCQATLAAGIPLHSAEGLTTLVLGAQVQYG